MTIFVVRFVIVGYLRPPNNTVENDLNKQDYSVQNINKQEEEEENITRLIFFSSLLLCVKVDSLKQFPNLGFLISLITTTSNQQRHTYCTFSLQYNFKSWCANPLLASFPFPDFSIFSLFRYLVLGGNGWHVMC